MVMDDALLLAFTEKEPGEIDQLVAVGGIK